MIPYSMSRQKLIFQRMLLWEMLIVLVTPVVQGLGSEGAREERMELVKEGGRNRGREEGREGGREEGREGGNEEGR